MKKLSKVLFTTVLISMLTFFCFGCTDNTSSADKNNETYVKLTSSEYVVNTNDNSVSKTITATVYPSTALNKSIDWSVDWDVNNEGENAVISDYITVTPIEDGSNVAIVTVFRDFQGSTFTICATTRVGGFSAFCKVSYVGVPSSFEIVQNGGTIVYDNNWETEINNLEMGQTYYFDLKLDNIFNNVTSDYEPNIKFSGSTYGAANYNVKFYNASANNDSWIFQSSALLKLETSFNSQLGMWMPGLGTDCLLVVEVEDGKIKITTSSYTSAFTGENGGDGFKNEWYFDSYENGIPFYLKLTVTDDNTGLSQTINIRTVPPVEGINLDSSELLI